MPARFRPRFSLLALLLGTVLLGSCLGLWWRWAPWVVVRVIQAHASSVAAVQFSPDGQLLTTQSDEDRFVNVWDAVTGEALATLDNRIGTWGYVVFSDDSRRVVTASVGDLAQVWEARTGKLLASLEHEAGTGGDAVWSPDGLRVATYGYGDNVIVWFPLSGEEQSIVKCADRVSALAFSPDSRSFATGDYAGEVLIWDAASGRKMRRMEPHPGPVWEVCYAPHGQQLLSASENELLRVTDLDTLHNTFVYRGAQVVEARFSSDGKTVEAYCADSYTRVWSLANGDLLRKGHGSLSIDGRRALSARCMIIDVATGETLMELGPGMPSALSDFAPVSGQLATGHSDGTLRIWRRRRPEWWWGAFWLPEMWLALLSGGALALVVMRALILQ